MAFGVHMSLFYVLSCAIFRVLPDLLVLLSSWHAVDVHFLSFREQAVPPGVSKPGTQNVCGRYHTLLGGKGPKNHLNLGTRGQIHHS